MKEDGCDLFMDVVNVADIIVKKRLRKNVKNIDALAADIRVNGIISPLYVMKTAEGTQLVAGLRRLRAAEQIGLKLVPVIKLMAADAEVALRIEFSENEQREPFMFSEKMDFALLFEDVVKAEALQRKSLGGKGGLNKADAEGEQGNDGSDVVRGDTRDIVGAMIGMSGMQYDRAKYVRQNAGPEVLTEVDEGKRSISGVYNELKAKEKAKKAKADADKMFVTEGTESARVDNDAGSTETPKKLTRAQKLREKQLAVLPPHDRAIALELEKFAKMTDKEKVVDLQRQLHEQRARAAGAETGWTREKELHYNNKLHMEATIDSQGVRIDKLCEGIHQLEAEVGRLNDENTALRAELEELKKGLQNNQ